MKVSWNDFIIGNYRVSGYYRAAGKWTQGSGARDLSDDQKPRTGTARVF